MPKPDELSFSVKKSLVVGSVVGAAAVTASCDNEAIVNPGPNFRDVSVDADADEGPDEADATDAGESDTEADSVASDASDAEGDGFDPSSCPDGAICNPVPDGVGGEEDADSGETDAGSE